MLGQRSEFKVHPPQYSPSSELVNVRRKAFGPMNMSSGASDSTAGVLGRRLGQGDICWCNRGRGGGGGGGVVEAGA